MGVFHLRCALSGLSTSGPHVDNVTCSMLLLEEIDGLLVPVLLPTSGVYDCYGRIELAGIDDDLMAHATWIGANLERLWDAGALRSDQPLPDDDLGGYAATVLALAADSVFNEFAITLDGHRIVPCLYRDDVADALAESVDADPSHDEAALVDALDDEGADVVYGDWLEQHGRPLQAAFVRRNRARGDAPSATRDIAGRFRRLLRYVEARSGGLRSFGVDYADQHGLEDIKQFADDATDPIVREMIEGWRDADATVAAIVRERNLPFHEKAAESAAGARAVTIAMVATVLARNHAAAIVDPIVAAIERSPHADRVLEILRAPRAANHASVSELDGVVAITAGAITVTNEEYPDVPQRVAHDDRAILVENGSRVEAGVRLTEGDIDVHDIVRIFGARRAVDFVVEQIAPLVDLDAASLGILVVPMLAHLVIAQTHERVTADEFGRWIDAGEGGIHAEQIVTSYATLADHRDPSIDPSIADVRARI